MKKNALIFLLLLSMMTNTFRANAQLTRQNWIHCTGILNCYLGHHGILKKGTSMKTLLVIVTTILFGQHGSAQNNQEAGVLNPLKIEFTDVVSQEPLIDLDLIIQDANETITIHVDSVTNLILDLKLPGRYTATVIKNGYDTLTAEWNNPQDSAVLILEFYVPKTTLSRRDKRKAHANSRKLPESPCDHCGGFQRTTPGFNEICVIRFSEFKSGQRTGGFYEFRK